MEELTTKIDRYLTDQMSDEEKSSFELDLENDPILKEELKLQEKTMALLERAAQIELKEKIAAMNQSSKGRSWARPLLSVAAILIVLLVPSYIYMTSQYSDANLYANYAEPYPDRITQMGAGEDELLNEAMEHYNKKEYLEALPLFDSIRSTYPVSSEIIVYQAVAYMETDQAQSAVDFLEMNLAGDSANNATLEWQLCLAYLANDEGDKAQELLNDFLKHNQGYQQENATQLLNDLESIWR